MMNDTIFDENTPYILIVEDSPTQAAAISHVLEEEGYRVDTALNGKDAMEIIRRRKPALILSDVLMPEMDGFELCNALINSADYRNIPLILLTALSNPEDIIMGLTHGADSYITKPWDKQLLLALIAALLTGPQEKHPVGESYNVTYAGKQHIIHSNPQQLLNFLVSTYENATRQQRQLAHMEKEMKLLSQNFEKKLQHCAAELQKEIARRKLTERQFSTLLTTLETDSDAIAITNHEDEITWVNDAFTALSGYHPDEVIGKKIDCLHAGAHDNQFYEEIQDIVKSGRMWNGEMICRRKDGTYSLEDQTIIPVSNESNKIYRMVTIKRSTATMDESVRMNGEIHE